MKIQYNNCYWELALNLSERMQKELETDDLVSVVGLFVHFFLTLIISAIFFQRNSAQPQVMSNVEGYCCYFTIQQPG